jgi:hypothetical protein
VVRRARYWGLLVGLYWVDGEGDLGARTRTLMVVIMVLLLSGILDRVSGVCFFEKCFGGCGIRSGNILVVVVLCEAAVPMVPKCLKCLISLCSSYRYVPEEAASILFRKGWILQIGGWGWKAGMVCCMMI